MGRKQDIDEELLAKKILDFESGSSDLGNLKWETIASEVFPRKKNVGIYWWSAGAAAAVVAVLLFFLPLKNEDSLSHRQSGVNPAGRIAENEAEQAVSSDLSDIQPPQVALAQVMDDPEAELPVAEVSPAVARTKAVLAEEASISGLNSSL